MSDLKVAGQPVSQLLGVLVDGGVQVDVGGVPQPPQLLLCSRRHFAGQKVKVKISIFTIKYDNRVFADNLRTN